MRVGGGQRTGRGDHTPGAYDGAAGLRHRRVADGRCRLAWAHDRDRAAKTGNPLTLPLPALVMGKLADYVLDERPSSSGDDHLFLRSVAPHTRLTDHASVHWVTVKTFRKAGVRDVKAGTRFLRHNAASRLLAAAVPLPTISAVLGHASAESTNLYMSVDRERLLDCVLPVPESVRS
jgi:integrase